MSNYLCEKEVCQVLDLVRSLHDKQHENVCLEIVTAHLLLIYRGAMGCIFDSWLPNGFQ